MIDPTDVQLVTWEFFEGHAYWPMWLSVAWRMVEHYEWDEGKVDNEIADAVRVHDVIPELRGRHWHLKLDPAVQDAIAVWCAHEEAHT